MEMLSLIGILVSLVLLVVLAMKGINIIILAPVLATLVILTSGMDFVQTITGPYMTGFSNFALRFFLVFMLGSVFGKLMQDSGAASSIAHGIVKITGKESQMRVLLTLTAITALLTYGGVSLFVAVFAIMPIARPLCKELDIPWPLFMGAFMFGMATFTMTMIPGTPQIQNVIPTTYLGTTLTAAPVVGLVAAAVVIVFNTWWLNHERKNYAKKGMGYEATKGKTETIGESKVYKPEENPSLILSLIPSIIMLVSLNVFKLNIVLGLAIAIIACVVLFFKYYDNLLGTLNQGAVNVGGPILNTCAVVGFGSVVSATIGFVLFKDALIGIPGHPLISFVIGTNLLAGITGSASGGLGIAMETLAPYYKPLLNPEAMHRLASIASGGLDAMPHNGAVITTLTVLGLTHKEGYKPIFMCAVIGPLVATVVAIALAIVMYS